jgi:hypothetical protein
VENDPYPNDVYPYHGTRVIGVLAAVTDNSIGIAGMAQATLMVEKFSLYLPTKHLFL